MQKLLKDPLLHFLLLGALLFLVFELVKSPVGVEENSIIITSGDVEALQANFSRTWQRPPTEKELAGLIEDMVREEMAYREALAMGLDQDDSVIRRRLRMKMELLAEDTADFSPPTDADLREYLAEHRDSFRLQPQVSFMHVYLNSDKRGAGVEDSARQILAKLSAAGRDVDLESLSDPTMLPKELPLYYVNDIGRLFGEDFSRQIVGIEPGAWTGPIRSGYGLHLVYVHERIAGRDPDLNEIRQQVEREWSAQQRKKFKEETYKKLRERYTVIIEGAPAATAKKIS
ncbi:MAG: peptidylprolyl isomerase, partial [Desulfobulbales bacterium]|nr:peptidylprolyl isomerase [Desulfobulbales bacterium]